MRVMVLQPGDIISIESPEGVQLNGLVTFVRVDVQRVDTGNGEHAPGRTAMRIEVEIQGGS